MYALHREGARVPEDARLVVIVVGDEAGEAGDQFARAFRDLRIPVSAMAMLVSVAHARGSPVAQGWWRFEVKGRDATPREPADPERLEALPRLRGHAWGSRLVREGAVAERLELMPEEEQPRLAPVSARRWHDGSLLFECVEFETEAEAAARRALAEGHPLTGIRSVGVPPDGPLGFSAEDESTMSALTSALGKPLRFSVVSPEGMVSRRNGRDVLVADEPWWAEALRSASGIRHTPSALA